MVTKLHMVRGCDGMGVECLDGCGSSLTDDWLGADGVTMNELGFWRKVEANKLPASLSSDHRPVSILASHLRIISPLNKLASKLS
jgi:hypothetical protein